MVLFHGRIVPVLFNKTLTALCRAYPTGNTFHFAEWIKYVGFNDSHQCVYLKWSKIEPHLIEKCYELSHCFVPSIRCISGQCLLDACNESSTTSSNALHTGDKFFSVLNNH